jgi:hypothetical protein
MARVLMLGPPSIRLEDEQRSPAVILPSWITAARSPKSSSRR